jgi:hypothetical protein
MMQFYVCIAWCYGGSGLGLDPDQAALLGVEMGETI